MATKIRFVLAILTVIVVGPNGFAGPRDVAPLVIEGVEYRLEQGRERASKVTLQALDSNDPAKSWSIPVFEPDSKRDGLGQARDFRVIASKDIGGGLIVETDSTAMFFVDLKSRKAEPILDLRSRAKNRCEAHQRPTVDALVPIHYGLVPRRPLSREERERFPLADRAFEGGCCVREERIARVMVCPED